MPLQIGSLLSDRYRINAVLGQGGMGAVYLANDESLAVPCAVKENLNLSPDTDRMFRREATLLAGLRHGALPRVTNHFVIGDQQYLVMDYIEGEDLRQRLGRDGPLPEPAVLGWAAQLCDALTYLHTRNPPVVHRDIKPANIKITPSGQAVLVDFGVAKHTSSDQKTATATSVFTPGFTPPEQYGLGRTDARADEYALGATLYTLLTGQAPPDSVDRLLGNAKLVPPLTLRPGLSATTAAAITRALEIKPEDRFPDVASFKAALQGHSPASAEETMLSRAAAAAQPPEPPRTWKPTPAASVPAAAAAAAEAKASAPPAVAAPIQPPAQPGQPPAALPAAPRSRSWMWLAGLGCVVLVIAVVALAGGGALGFMLTRPTATPTSAPTQTPAAAATSALPPSATVPHARPSSTSAPASHTPAPSSTPATATAGAPPSPTGQPSPGGPATTQPAVTPTTTVTATRAATAAPAGTQVGGGGRLAFISNRDGKFFQIYTMNPDGGDVKQVTTDPVNKWDPNWPFNGTQLAWSPDGKQLIYVAENADGKGTELWLINASGGNPVNLTDHAGDDFQPDWCGDGSIWFASNRTSNGVQQVYHTDLKSIASGFGPINFSATHNFTRDYDPTLYPGCQRALFVTTLDGPPELWRYWPDCPACFSVVRSAKDQGGKTEEPALSPDGQYLAYTQELPGANEIVIGKVNDRTVNVQVTTTKNNSQAQWSPDGRWLVFVSSRDGNPEIYTMTLAGTSQTNISKNPAVDVSAIWQPRT